MGRLQFTGTCICERCLVVIIFMLREGEEEREKGRMVYRLKWIKKRINKRRINKIVLAT